MQKEEGKEKNPGCQAPKGKKLTNQSFMSDSKFDVSILSQSTFTSSFSALDSPSHPNAEKILKLKKKLKMIALRYKKLKQKAVM